MNTISNYQYQYTTTDKSEDPDKIIIIYNKNNIKYIQPIDTNELNNISNNQSINNEDDYIILNILDIKRPLVFIYNTSAQNQITPQTIFNYGDINQIIDNNNQDLINYLVIIPTITKVDSDQTTPFDFGIITETTLQFLIMPQLNKNETIHKQVKDIHLNNYKNLDINDMTILTDDIKKAETNPEPYPVNTSVTISDKKEDTTYNTNKEDDNMINNNQDSQITEEKSEPESDLIEFDQPLATRMRPRNLSEVVGQDHYIGENKMLTMMTKTNQLNSIVLYGEPGIGKTSIAHALAGELNTKFEYHNAGVHSKKDLQNSVKKGEIGKPIILLIDEIHRLNKPNQDYLLPHIESGALILVGATTDNPYINMNPALRSRSRILDLKPIKKEDIMKQLNKALHNKERGLGQYNIKIKDELLDHIAIQANGDLRNALNTLELASLSTPINENNNRIVTTEIINNCLPKRQIGGDKDGDSHYNLLSAFQKSIRGSDVNASMHYLARLIEAGDLVSINRRLLVIAYEDIGLGDPKMGEETLAAIESVNRLGLPEARIPLAQIVTQLALSPKSNVAYRAIDLATEALYQDRSLEIPKHLQDTHYKGAKELGNGEGYKYAHDYPFNVAVQNHLPQDFINDEYLQFRDDTDTTFYRKRYINVETFRRGLNN